MEDANPNSFRQFMEEVTAYIEDTEPQEGDSLCVQLLRGIKQSLDGPGFPPAPHRVEGQPYDPNDLDHPGVYYGRPKTKA